MELQKIKKRTDVVTKLIQKLDSSQYNFIQTFIPTGSIMSKDDTRKLKFDNDTPISKTSGSTGTPVIIPKTEDSIIWHIATNQREFIWRKWKPNDRRFIKVSILARFKEDEYFPDTNTFIKKLCPISEIQRFLENKQPHFLYTYPSIIDNLDLTKLHNIIDIRSCGEKNATSYSCEEAGTLALKCPEFGNYHIMENIVLESNAKLGVLVTDLSNPTITRYTLGDVIELAPETDICKCGRKLRMIKNIQGRIRNMLILPNGDKVWPTVGEPKFLSITHKIKRHQVIQTSLHNLLVKLQVSDELTKNEENSLIDLIITSIGYSFKVDIEYVNDFPFGKFEAFKCLL